MNIPKAITRPRSALRIAAAAMGPGVGGTRQWVVIRPVDKAIAEPAREILAFFESALLRDERMTKPESAKTGMETR